MKRAIALLAITGGLLVGTAGTASAEHNPNSCVGFNTQFFAQAGKNFDEGFRGFGGFTKAVGFEGGEFNGLIRMACNGS